MQRSFLRPHEAARLLGVSVQTVKAWIDAGRLPAIRLPVTQERRVARADAARFLLSLSTTPATPAGKTEA